MVGCISGGWAGGGKEWGGESVSSWIIIGNGVFCLASVCGWGWLGGDVLGVEGVEGAHTVRM